MDKPLGITAFSSS